MQVDINPGEAARNSVWSFIAIILLPDVVKWRFSSATGSVSAKRYLGGVRNTFQRLWWRGHVFYDPEKDDPYHYVRVLSEDALVAIMERPGLSSNTRIARSLAEAIHSLESGPEDYPYELRQEIWRNALKRIRQRLVVANLESLGHKILMHMINDFFKRAAEELSSESRELNVVMS